MTLKKLQKGMVVSMKKRILLLITVSIFAVGGILLALAASAGKKPFKNLDETRIVSAAVHLTPPDKTIQITDIGELLSYLRDVVIYEKDNSYTEYNGQGVTFTLTMDDGSQISILSYNPFLVIDGVGYRTKYKPCAALSSYANRLLKSGDATVIPEKPPALSVASDEPGSDALPGTYSWTRNNNAGAHCDTEIDSERTVQSLRIVDGADTGSLVLAGKNSDSVYTLTVGDTPVYLDGVPADASVLEDGMMAEITHDGVQETYPGGFYNVSRISVYSRGTEKNPLGEYYDLCGFYLQVLEDLWEKDGGLNSSVSYVSIDLSEAPGNLTEGEKSAVTWIFSNRHLSGDAGLSLTFEELREQGYLTEEPTGFFQWEDGVLLSVTAHKTPDSETEKVEIYSLPVLKFDAQKWRSSRGAYIFLDCTAVWPEAGTWSGYNIGGEAVS